MTPDLYERLGRIEEKIDRLSDLQSDFREITKHMEQQKGALSTLRFMVNTLLGCVAAVAAVVAAIYPKGR